MVVCCGAPCYAVVLNRFWSPFGVSQLNENVSESSSESDVDVAEDFEDSDDDAIDGVA